MGFSLIGLLIVLINIAPNLLYIQYPPKNTPSNLKGTPMLFTILERIGQASFFLILILSKSNFVAVKLNGWFFLMAICTAIYYGLWIRYAVQGNSYSLLFRPLWMIPIPMAVFPVLSFGFAALWGQSIYLGIAVVVFACGHFVNSWNSYIQTK